MKIDFVNDNVIVHNVDDFDLSHIFLCGQCFRFNPHADGGYIGTANGKTVRITQNNSTVVFHNTSREDFEGVWCDYFDLDRDYGKIKEALLNDGDEVMAKAIEYGCGIRILKQDLWETVVSFIISASNNIPRIKKIINTLCHEFGTPHIYDGETYYSFPTPEVIAGLSAEDLSVIRAGFREKYILSCAKAVVSGEFELNTLYTMSTTDAKKALMSLPGIGNKVSDCILLFALNRFDSFPVDVWIKRIMEFCYFNNKQQTVDTISKLAQDKFGALGGIAQQYLFYYAHDLKIGT